jgi:hypothetical protein
LIPPFLNGPILGQNLNFLNQPFQSKNYVLEQNHDHYETHEKPKIGKSFATGISNTKGPKLKCAHKPIPHPQPDPSFVNPRADTNITNNFTSLQGMGIC